MPVGQHRVHHQVGEPAGGLGHQPHDLGSSEQAGLDRRRRKIGQQRVELGPDDVEIDRLHPLDHPGVLGGDGGDDGGGVHAVGGQSFQVGLGARPCPRVAPRDRHDDGGRGHGSAQVKV